jgi:hypothetical protein
MSDYTKETRTEQSINQADKLLDKDVESLRGIVDTLEIKLLGSLQVPELSRKVFSGRFQLEYLVLARPSLGQSVTCTATRQ